MSDLLGEISLMDRFAKIAGQEVQVIVEKIPPLSIGGIVYESASYSFARNDKIANELIDLLASSGFGYHIKFSDDEATPIEDLGRANVRIHKGDDNKWRIGQQITLG